ncbi:hypothetical protein U9M48_002818, partial [Paspalum notatum var. saurae]
IAGFLKSKKTLNKNDVQRPFFKWNIIRLLGLMDFLQSFIKNSEKELPLFSLNFGVIKLIPKVQEANVIQQYRPIYLLNVCFKIFTKVATNRLNMVADKVVSLTQISFLRGRNILEGVVILHETVHELHRRKLSEVILKLDFEKAYDKGFSSKWISWIQSFISGGSVAINKGLRQGDPLSPLLFNILADMLAKAQGLVGGIVPHLIDEGLSILQYADDTILFLEHDLEKACKMKLLLTTFEQVSGPKINFHKSELLCFGRAQDSIDQYKDIFGCKHGEIPLRYLGIPIHFKKKLKNADWKQVEER